jgi:hypothetical protein
VRKLSADDKDTLDALICAMTADVEAQTLSGDLKNADEDGLTYPAGQIRVLLRALGVTLEYQTKLGDYRIVRVG